MGLPIPQPPALPFVGNIADISSTNRFAGFCLMAQKYGEIYKLSILGRDIYLISTAALMNEVCDESRFHKAVRGGLEELRYGVGSGLFTAYEGEHEWEIAHRVLVPAFGPIGIQHMWDEMYDIATQLVAKWARLGGDEKIDVTSDFTRLTLDSIALAAMDKRFNSFYHDELHPFVGAMTDYLKEGALRASRSRIEAFLNPQYQRKFDGDIALMRGVAAEVIAHRRANPSDKKDLLNALLFGKDPKTGERLSDDAIMNNMITFLIAGHETTAGLLSFACYYMLKYPEVLHKAQEEVDRVVGGGPPTYQHMSKLPYIEAILRETIRLQPSAPAIATTPNENGPPTVLLGGKYEVPAGATILCLLPQIQRDPAAYGPDANEFRPERMLTDNFAKLAPGSWKPFGNGKRGCIGRPFAWQEAVLCLSLVLQNFNLRFDNPSYDLQIVESLTFKPGGFFMRANLREGIEPIGLEKKLFSADVKSQPAPAKQAALVSHADDKSAGKPLTILYGSNSGTCENLSQTLASAASAHGFNAEVRPLDTATDKLPSDRPVIIITASYEGNPPDNAATFVEWLKRVEAARVKDVHYAVYGCGHHDWVATYQRIPKLIDSELSSKGARQIVPRGESDVAEGGVFDAFDAWQDSTLWPALVGDSSPKGSNGSIGSEKSVGLAMEIKTGARASHLRHTVQDAIVTENKLLTQPGAPEKRHTAIKLPTSMTYEAGDYLALLPVNDVKTVSRVLRRFNLPWDAIMRLGKGTHTTIPTETDIPVSTVLAAYVELNMPATKKNLATIAEYAEDAAIKDALTGNELFSDAKTPSLLDILEKYPKIALPFSVYLSMLVAMRIRQYSISSSPLADPTMATITYSVAEDNAGHLGVATHYLREVSSGSSIHVAIKKPQSAFHPPLDPKTPLVMVCAGSGLAPFRGFVQQRATQMAAASDEVRAQFAPALLFVGCRHPDEDSLYRDELAAWEAQGAVEVYYAYSRAAAQSAGCRYVQDRLWHERARALELYDAGARMYICGSSKLGRGVHDVITRIGIEAAQRKGCNRSYEEISKMWSDLRGERYAVDVFD